MLLVRNVDFAVEAAARGSRCLGHQRGRGGGDGRLRRRGCQRRQGAGRPLGGRGGAGGAAGQDRGAAGWRWGKLRAVRPWYACCPTQRQVARRVWASPAPATAHRAVLALPALTMPLLRRAGGEYSATTTGKFVPAVLRPFMRFCRTWLLGREVQAMLLASHGQPKASLSLHPDGMPATQHSTNNSSSSMSSSRIVARLRPAAACQPRPTRGSYVATPPLGWCSVPVGVWVAPPCRVRGPMRR